jgi:glycosyltransferase involved in cell wall biosynthesis
MNGIALIVSTYNQPAHLDKCLLALQKQDHDDFNILIADDGSAAETREVIDRHRAAFRHGLTHLWQEDQGFRKTRILNQAILETTAEYLVFMDGDCLAHPQFVQQHVANARAGSYLNGAMIRLNEQLTVTTNNELIESGEVFDTAWLRRTGGRWNRRFLKLSLPFGLRKWLNRVSPTQLYWLGANSSCFRSDALTVNGFDNRFTYGFEDGDFGNRLENFGLTARTVRWTANVLHLDHGRPYSDPDEMARNRAMETQKAPGGVYEAAHGLRELQAALSETS